MRKWFPLAFALGASAVVSFAAVPANALIAGPSASAGVKSDGQNLTEQVRWHGGGRGFHGGFRHGGFRGFHGGGGFRHGGFRGFHGGGGFRHGGFHGFGRGFHGGGFRHHGFYGGRRFYGGGFYHRPWGFHRRWHHRPWGYYGYRPWAYPVYGGYYPRRVVCRWRPRTVWTYYGWQVRPVRVCFRRW